jgi:hypothetical protein
MSSSARRFSLLVASSGKKTMTDDGIASASDASLN